MSEEEKRGWGPPDRNAGSEWEPVGGEESADGGAGRPRDDDEYGPPADKAGGKATGAMVCGIIGLAMTALNCCCGGFSSLAGLALSIVALVLGVMELKAIDQGLSSAVGAGQARAGKIMGIIGIVVHVLFIIGFIIYFVLIMAVSVADSGGAFN